MSRSRREIPVCRSVGAWLQGHLGRDCLAPLTGQDARALHAFVHLLELYAVSDPEGRRVALVALGATVHAMQPQTRELAKRAIPHVLDWGDEDPLWATIYERTEYAS